MPPAPAAPPGGSSPAREAVRRKTVKKPSRGSWFGIRCSGSKELKKERLSRRLARAPLTSRLPPARSTSSVPSPPHPPCRLSPAPPCTKLMDAQQPLAPDSSAPARNQRSTLTSAGVIIVVTFLPLLLGWGVAELIYNVSSARSSYADKIAILSKYDLAWLYAAALVLSKLTALLNNLPLVFKTQALPQLPGVRVNMFVYRLRREQPSDEEKGLVLLDDTGEAGRYNRANRSLAHFVETSLPLMMAVPLAGFVFPRSTFVIVVLLTLGRIAHMMGYVMKGYGGHSPGFAVVSLCCAILDGMLLCATLRVAHAFS
eukprot:scaffold181954_cov36-Tisochrysis_lutea.AAC.1